MPRRRRVRDARTETMKLHVDKEADGLYLRLDDSEIVETEEVAPGAMLDYNASNEVVGVEMLHLSKRLAEAPVERAGLPRASSR